jgi:hypothetical protein
MPAKAGIHAFLCRDEDKAWLPAGAGPRALDPWAGMTWVQKLGGYRVSGFGMCSGSK